MGDGALEEHGPVRLLRYGTDHLDSLVVVFGHGLVVLGVGKHAAIGEIGTDILRIGLQQGLQVVARFLHLARLRQRQPELQLGDAVHRRIFRHVAVEGDGAVGLFHRLGKSAEKDQRISALRIERPRRLKVKRDDLFGTFAVQRARDGKHHGSRAFNGIGDLLRRLLALLDGLAKRFERRIVRRKSVADRNCVQRLLLVAG
ncbi:hypothetical protein D3C87_1496220 [compost metagenome]